MAVIVNFKIIMDSGNNPGSTCTVKEVLSCCEAMPSQEDGSQSLELRLPGSALLGRLAKLHWARVGGWYLTSFTREVKYSFPPTLWLSNTRHCTKQKNNQEEECHSVFLPHLLSLLTLLIYL